MPGPTWAETNARTDLIEDKDESKLIHNGAGEGEAPKDRVGPLEGSIWGDRHPQQDETRNNCHQASEEGRLI